MTKPDSESGARRAGGSSDRRLHDGYQKDGCFYTTLANQFVPPSQPGYLQQHLLGCTVANAAGQPFYHDEINQT